MRAYALKSTPTASWSAPVLQRKCKGCGAAMSSGTCTRCGATEETEQAMGVVMPKLHVSQPGDPHEREADAVADAVVAGTPIAARLATPTKAAASVQRAAVEIDDETFDWRDEEDEAETDDAAEDLEVDTEDDIEGALMLKSKPASSTPVSALSGLRVPQSGGAALTSDVRRSMEGRFGHSFADVAVHSDSAAAQSAERIGARAYTLGSHVFFGQGEFQPGSREGQRLLAHELTHVLQQRAGPAQLARDKTKKTPGSPPKGNKPKPAKPGSKKPAGPKRIEVYLDQQKAVAFEGKKPVRTMSISSGKPGHPTDPGKFSVSQKHADHKSSLYGTCGTRKVSKGKASCKAGETYEGTPMPNFLRFNGAEGFHQGKLPGHPDSHGCVRLSKGDSKWLYDWTPQGTPVEVMKKRPKATKQPDKTKPGKGTGRKRP